MSDIAKYRLVSQEGEVITLFPFSDDSKFISAFIEARKNNYLLEISHDSWRKVQNLTFADNGEVLIHLENDLPETKEIREDLRWLLQQVNLMGDFQDTVGIKIMRKKYGL